MPSGQRKRLRRAVAPYRTSLWLLGLAVLLGVTAYVIYPKDVPGPPADAVQAIVVEASFTPDAINVNQTPDPQVDGFTLQVVLHDANRQPQPPPQPQPDSPSVEVILPGDAWGSHFACPHPGVCPHDNAGRKDALYFFPGKWAYNGSELPADRWELTFSVKVSDVGSNLSSNDAFISVLTPPIAFRQTPSGAYQRVSTLYAEQVAGGGAYTWSTGTDPVYADGFDRWAALSAETNVDTVSPTLNSGTDLGVQARNGNIQFIAGIVVGVAGGALIGALQEWLDGRRKAEQTGGANPAS
jgi:hypothetical protein